MALTSGNEGQVFGWSQIGCAVIRLAVFILILYSATFVLFDLGPDAAVRQLGWQAIDARSLEIRRESLGLDGAWYHRYAQRLGNLLTGDFGVSMNGGWEVAPVFMRRLRVSAGIWASVTALVVMLPIPLALAFCSQGRVGRVSRLVRRLAPLGLAPQFLAAAVSYAVWQTLLMRHVPEDLRKSSEWMMVIATSAAFPLALVYLAASNSARTIAQEPFVTAYRAKGLSWAQIRWRIIRNIWIECRVIVWRSILAVLVGSIFGELLFEIDGLGRLFLEAIRTRDLPVIEMWALLIGSLTFGIVTQERRGRWN
jgi:peptide/nickel transport system permease protein